jgi:hypothetical protein
MNILDRIKALEKKQVTIGIHGMEGEQKKLVRRVPAYRKAKKGQRETVDQNLTVAQVAFYNEFGTSKIPERSFLRSVFRKKNREITLAANRILMNDPDKFYEMIGQFVLTQMKMQISNNIPPALKPETIRRKGSSTALVDTGQLRTALTYRVGSYE